MSKTAIRLDPETIVRLLAITIGLLALAHLVTQLMKYQAGAPEVYGLVPLFDMGEESNVPTFFSGLQLLLCALLLYVIARSRAHRSSSDHRYWFVLALIFLAFTADEMASMHELTIRVMAEWFPGLTSGYLLWGWVMPAALLVVVVAVAYARFVLRLPAPTRNRTIIGAVLFVGGAIGVEMPEAAHVEQHGMENLGYGLFVLVEEVLEMAGVLVFLSGLLIYLRDCIGPIEIAVRSAPLARSALLRPDRGERLHPVRSGVMIR